jgi:Protein of unknown function (DUF1549)/Protein of unknown function (DUF1553)/Planctomycete cytochrome C
MNRFLLGMFLLPLFLNGQAQDRTAEKREFFEKHVRPVLAQNCFACHTNSKMAGLRLDSREDILKGGKSGPAIVPGDPDKSLMIAAVREARMPKDGHLQPSQIDDLVSWVKDGAYWPESASLQLGGKPYTITAAQRQLWSIQPLQTPAPPKITNAAWAANDIDRFVVARLEKEGIQQAPLADRRTLLRRVTYDLTGLPPMEEEVKAFESDKSPNAYEKVVDRLLASPHYGEKWGRHWLDVVRYGEDDYRIAKLPDHMEKYPHAYVFRDWVIRSFNEDMPYDTFVKAQLAADQMDEKQRAKLVPGLGMNGLGVWAFNDSPPPIERADEWNDKVDTTTKAFLGLTVGCARCHDHKYDPIPTKDYYRLVSVFASTKYHPYPLVPKAVVDEYEGKKKELEDREKAQKKYLNDLSGLYAQMLLAQTEDYMVASWRVKTQKKATVASIAEEFKLDTDLLERWVRFTGKPTLAYGFLKPWQEMIARSGSLEEAQKLAHNFAEKAKEVSKLQAKMQAENEIEMAKHPEKEEKFDEMPNGIKRKLNPYQIELKSLERDDAYLWTDLFDTDLNENPTTPFDEPEKHPGLLKLTGWALEKRLSPDLAKYVVAMQAETEAFKKAMPPQYPFAYGIQEASEPVNVKVFVRGNPYSFGEEAPRGFLSLLSPGEPEPFKQGSGRLELAEAIVKQPISMRVIVNRVWRWHMGAGISETPNNFGKLGDKPSNPELLDYLASKFVADGMSIKKLHKEILLSRTYQLSTVSTDATDEKDPENRLYSHASRRRLESEDIWDSLLTASGNLDLNKVGGPSEELADNMNRRGLYESISRVFPNTIQTTFDFPNATLSAERRYATNVPLQRLFFLNGSFVQKQAEALAKRVLDAGNEEAQVKKAFEIVLQRQPTAAELRDSLELLHSPAASAPANKAAIPPGASSFAAKPAPAEVSVMAPAAPESPAVPADSPLKALCWALLSSNEFLFLN